MNKVTVKIDGMKCSKCEAHVCQALGQICGSKAKISASHDAGTAEIILEESPDVGAIKTAVQEAGYQVLDVTVQPYKKHFSLFGL